MVAKYKMIRVHERTHTLAMGLAKAWGVPIDDAVVAALLTLDRAKGGDSHRILAERVTEIRTKMRAKAGRDDAVRRAAASGRKKHGLFGKRFDHSVWKWEDFKIGEPVFFKEGLHHGAWQAAKRYCNEHRGYTMTWQKVDAGYFFTRTS